LIPAPGSLYSRNTRSSQNRDNSFTPQLSPDHA